LGAYHIRIYERSWRKYLFCDFSGYTYSSWEKNVTLCDFNFQHVVCTQAQMANSGFILGLFLDGFFHLFFSVCSWWRLDFRTKHALFLEKAEHSFFILLFLPFSHSHLFHSFIKPCPFVSSYFPEHIKASCLFHPSSISYLAKLQ